MTCKTYHIIALISVHLGKITNTLSLFSQIRFRWIWLISKKKKKDLKYTSCTNRPEISWDNLITFLSARNATETGKEKKNDVVAVLLAFGCHVTCACARERSRRIECSRRIRHCTEFNVCCSPKGAGCSQSSVLCSQRDRPQHESLSEPTYPLQHLGAVLFVR